MTKNRALKAFRCIPLCWVVLLATACGNSKPQRDADAIIHNATIVDIETGSLIVSKAIVINEGQIRDIILEKDIQDYAAGTVIDGGGAFLIPALADAHVHIQTHSELRSYVRYGVGLVVNMAGGPQHLEMRNAVERAFRAENRHRRPNARWRPTHQSPICHGQSRQRRRDRPVDRNPRL